MSNFNPYTPAPNFPVEEALIQKISIQPIELFKRSYAMIREQYWLFFAIVLLGILLGSVVPFGILMGPFMVGIYLCFIQREQGNRVQFETLFKGFDYFMNAFVAMLIMVGVSLLLMIPLFIAFLVAMITMIPRNGGGDPGLAFAAIIIPLYLSIILVSVAIYIPFIFTFQLIADRGLSASQAVLTSLSGVRSNLIGILLFVFVSMVASILCAMLCYFPTFLFMPIMMGANFLLYRDIYGPRPTGMNSPLGVR